MEDVEALCNQIIVISNGMILTCDSTKRIMDYGKGKLFLVREEQLLKLEKEYYLERYIEGEDGKKCQNISVRTRNAETIGTRPK
ncbi:MAG: hypothetical protein MSG78_09150 [Clostridiales bacterium]|nr:hypothetical protein [Clostridiales bacterium]